jgi:hypothetical protein
MNLLRSMFLVCITIVILSSNSIVIAKPDQMDRNEEATERLRRLEPETPKDITVPGFAQPELQTKMVSPLEIMKSGSPLTHKMLMVKPDWERPLYKAYWHSSGGRWSYVPLRLYYAQHQLFTSFPAAASEHYDFVHNTGLAQEMMGISTEEKGASQVVVMQAKIEKVITKGNQVVIVARPQRTGVEAFTVSKLDMHLDNQNEAVLFQLVTPHGDEIDYSVYR